MPKPTMRFAFVFVLSATHPHCNASTAPSPPPRPPPTNTMLLVSWSTTAMHMHSFATLPVCLPSCLPVRLLPGCSPVPPLLPSHMYCRIPRPRPGLRPEFLEHLEGQGRSPLRLVQVARQRGEEHGGEALAEEDRHQVEGQGKRL
jgi:hypothetical protein